MKKLRLKKTILLIICEVIDSINDSTWSIIELTYPHEKFKVKSISRDIWEVADVDVYDKAGGRRNKRVQTEEEN